MQKLYGSIQFESVLKAYELSPEELEQLEEVRSLPAEEKKKRMYGIQLQIMQRRLSYFQEVVKEMIGDDK